MSLLVGWDKRIIGSLERVSDSSREYRFKYEDAADRPRSHMRTTSWVCGGAKEGAQFRVPDGFELLADGKRLAQRYAMSAADKRWISVRSRWSRTLPCASISLSLPLVGEPYSPAESRPFFEALLPEGVVREQIANQLKLAASDSYGLLTALGRDCAGALQILESKRMSDPPTIEWLQPPELDRVIDDLPRRPLAIDPSDSRTRLILAGVQRKAVLARDEDGTFGKPLSGAPSTHILKPEFDDAEYPAIARNEYFCMQLARRCRLNVAHVELHVIATRPCLVVERYDRDISVAPTRRLHQEDLCQALGITPDFKYQKSGWARPSYATLAELLNRHSSQPGVERLTAARHALFNFIVGNADAHAKNVSFLHEDGGSVRLAPLYDVVCTAAYPDLTGELSLGIGDEFDPAKLDSAAWSDFAHDFGLQLGAFRRERNRLARTVLDLAHELRQDAQREGWFDPVLDAVCATVAARTQQITST